MSIAYRRILLTLDGSPLAAQALPHAKEMVNLFDAELIVLRVFSDAHEHNLHHVPTGLISQVSAYTQKMIDRWYEQAQHEQKTVVERLQAEGVNAQGELLDGAPAESIIAYAQSADIDLIVMSTHGRTGPARWLHGSVAEKVLQEAPCPIYLVRVASEQVESGK